MTLEQAIALAAFAFVASITPGPNNLMLMASGANFGWVRTLPHMLGISVGFVVMVALVGVGLAQVFTAYPLVFKVLQVVSLGYLLFLAWKIATAAGPANSKASGKPFTFIQAALFQWVNPKAWAMALTAMSVYTPSSEVFAVLMTALVFGAVNLPCITLWALLGTQVQRVLTNPDRLRVFNSVMALLLVGSLLPVVFSQQA